MGWYGDLALDRTLLGWVYAATYYGFFATQDDGASWQEKSEGLADVIEPGPAGRSYGLLSLAQLPTTRNTGFTWAPCVASTPAAWLRPPGRRSPGSRSMRWRSVICCSSTQRRMIST